MNITLFYREDSNPINISSSRALLYVDKGEGMLLVNEIHHVRIEPNRIFALPSDVRVPVFEGMLVGYLIEFAQNLLDHFLLIHARHFNKGLFDVKPVLPFVDLVTNGVYFLRNLIAQLTVEIELGIKGYYEHYLFMLLLHCNRQAVEDIEENYTEDKALQISALIMAHFLVTRKTSFYADKLNMSDRELNNRCHAFYNKSFLEVLYDLVCYEAEKRLAFMEQPIKVIAWDMGFERRNAWAPGSDPGALPASG